MTVAELIDALHLLDPNRIVIMSSDSEGNSFDVVRLVDPCAYDPEDREAGLEHLTPEVIALGYDEEDLCDGVPAVCLWP